MTTKEPWGILIVSNTYLIDKFLGKEFIDLKLPDLHAFRCRATRFCRMAFWICNQPKIPSIRQWIHWDWTETKIRACCHYQIAASVQEGNIIYFPIQNLTSFGLQWLTSFGAQIGHKLPEICCPKCQPASISRQNKDNILWLFDKVYKLTNESKLLKTNRYLWI